MRLNILKLWGAVLIALLLVGCARTPLTETEEKSLEAELEQISDEELDQIIAQGESQDTRALAGQAYQTVMVGNSTYEPSLMLKLAYKTKLNRLKSKRCT